MSPITPLPRKLLGCFFFISFFNLKSSICFFFFFSCWRSSSTQAETPHGLFSPPTALPVEIHCHSIT